MDVPNGKVSLKMIQIVCKYYKNIIVKCLRAFFANNVCELSEWVETSRNFHIFSPDIIENITQMQIGEKRMIWRKFNFLTRLC